MHKHYLKFELSGEGFFIYVNEKNVYKNQELFTMAKTLSVLFIAKFYQICGVFIMG